MHFSRSRRVERALGRILALLACLCLMASAAAADLLVIASTVPGIKAEAMLPDDASLSIPKEADIYLQRLPDGKKFFIAGPFEGTLADFINQETERQRRSDERKSEPRRYSRPAPAAPRTPARPAIAPSYEEKAQGNEPFVIVRIFYATDRRATGDKAPENFFGGDRGTLSYGTAEVSIPRDHRLGELETPSIWRLEKADPARHVVLMSLTERQRLDYFNDLKDRIQQSSGRSAFIFIHGYNVGFADAARRTAQMSYDLGFNGAPIFYSWPSQASVQGYPIDASNIEWAIPNIKSFLIDIAEQSTAENIFLIAHSMGNRGLTRAVKELAQERPDVRARFSEIILAAPDIDADVFKRDIAPALVAAEHGVTLYASGTDQALLASMNFNGYPRAGDAKRALLVVPGIDTIDATEVSTDFLGHCYYAESTSIIADMFALIRERKRPDARKTLRAVDRDFGRYWTILRAKQP